MKILLIADDSLGRSWPCDDQRKSVTRAGTPEEASAALANEVFDVIIVDASASPEAGLSFILQWCMPFGHTPLLALTSRHNDDRIRALGLGADDALTQPTDVGEMLARCAALIRLRSGENRSLIQCGSLSLLLESREVWYRNVPVLLTAKEYSILEMLMLRQGGLITTEMLMNRLYGDRMSRQGG
jgi:DNA-binding response OmpR family regulator